MLRRTSRLLRFVDRAVACAFALSIFAFGLMAFDAEGREAQALRQAYDVISGERGLSRVCDGEDVSACVDLPEVKVTELRAELRKRLG
jgi:hypothetical protein